ncbi:hypothetical protein T09_8865 [Trichinella sp. T9]|nr:hypothetical protein T09_8865 [Trichinella sp. T9]
MTRMPNCWFVKNIEKLNPSGSALSSLNKGHPSSTAREEFKIHPLETAESRSTLPTRRRADTTRNAQQPTRPTDADHMFVVLRRIVRRKNAVGRHFKVGQLAGHRRAKHEITTTILARPTKTRYAKADETGSANIINAKNIPHTLLMMMNGSSSSSSSSSRGSRDDVAVSSRRDG